MPREMRYCVYIMAQEPRVVCRGDEESRFLSGLKPLRNDKEFNDKESGVVDPGLGRRCFAQGVVVTVDTDSLSNHP
jgi:hypothetical protein